MFIVIGDGCSTYSTYTNFCGAIHDDKTKFHLMSPSANEPLDFNFGLQGVGRNPGVRELTFEPTSRAVRLSQNLVTDGSQVHSLLF